MSTKLHLYGALLLVLGGGIAVAWIGWPDVPSRDHQAPTPPNAPATLERTPPAATSAAAVPMDEDTAPSAIVSRVDLAPVPASTAPTDERSLMAKLHDLGATDPGTSLRLAREGNARYPRSPDAPERAWLIAKSLVALERFAEAKQEALTMLQDHPDTPWTSDVERHLLTNPLE